MGEGGWKGSDAGAGRQAMPGEGQAGRQVAEGSSRKFRIDP